MFSSRLRLQKEEKQRQAELYKALADAEAQLVSASASGNDVDDALSWVQVAKAAVLDISSKFTAAKCLVWRTMSYEYCDWVGHHLAGYTRQRVSHVEIRVVQDPSGNRVDDDDSVTEVFRSYFESLYKAGEAEAELPGEDLLDFLDSIPFETLGRGIGKYSKHPFPWRNNRLLFGTSPQEGLWGRIKFSCCSIKPYSLIYKQIYCSLSVRYRRDAHPRTPGPQPTS
ncbi:hypothetical protein NDU88_004109 [Pleurodeles waltl]|uniref:Uncharacterized protein n=1 Tax=Pleurodeles waltl TaxID=8319 RepID=A0AAV7MU91_PLEWA|nr:hypothetical protein NDU88_004109 [Pleurodeles waltl]